MAKQITDKTLPDFIQKYIAKASIGASTLRSQVTKGGIAKCREYCASQIKLDTFQNALKGSNYQKYLDKETDKLTVYAKSKKLQWASARKILNIFFRRVSMDAILNNGRLPDSLFHKLEIPVDSKVAKKLKAQSGQKLPRWKSIKSLGKDDHQKFQDAAIVLAKQRNIPSVFLDFEAWTE